MDDSWEKARVFQEMKFHGNYTKTIPLLLLLVFTALAGCLDFFAEIPTMYEPHPTSIHYDIWYGYRVNTSGMGRYSIEYLCDLPEVLQGSVVSTLLYQEEYENVTLVNNQMVQWNISNDASRSYELGIVANVDVESFLLADLNGADAWTVNDIARLQPETLQKFGQPQANETTILIDPFDPMINVVARMVQNQSTSNNSLLLAKSLFIWLKENTQYQIHGGQGTVQPARLTMQKKSVKNETPSTPAIPHLRALNKMLDHILEEEGPKNRYKRHANLAAHVREWALKEGFEIFSEEGYHSNTVVTIKNTLNIDVDSLVKKSIEKGYRFVNGYGAQLKEKTFRIAAMGQITMEMLDEFLGVITNLLAEVK